MKFSIIGINACLAATALLASTSDAYSQNVPKVTPVTQSNVLDANADVAMSQYEAALKAAFEQASASALQEQVAATESPTVLVTPTFSTSTSTSLYQEGVEEQDNAINQYEAALQAALESSSRVDETVAAHSPVVQQGQEQPNWESISESISMQIEKAESKIGGPLSAAAKGEIVGTVLAGSAVLGTAAINSPLLMGAALGYGATHVLNGKRGEELKRVSKDAILNALTFTQTQLEEEQGDISKASARILKHIQHEAQHKAEQVSRDLSNAPAHLVEEGKKMVTAKIMDHIQHEAQNKAMEAQKVAQDRAQQVSSHLVEEGKKIVSSEEFKQMPNRTFKAVQAFLGSDEVKRAKESVVKSIKDGLDSEELKAVKDRASRSLKDM
mmetsp:Transcript_13528/g.38050  ORF Transcript_13528/g.38050 Transcript_13528/m.38050 type:complete len:384 (+) Transcript_13528:93-1244(+)|eukprot:CAMPEP_0172367832 /NCGR_PEP_ID=MMETSP1060-20121228/23887_1 /TAXON_ID=37318 /ORGANISM="Pseudo-nitzschia pungens, Strain cf. cingulata" /LENGTH=383 /DNA_ID=CAMNT_0013092215 /DNA_START=39 /DNA_END=1190 /DNA_ORIENTATION=-